jgi:DNA invertase Pin-like site-specific DNA recombinase
MSKVGYARVSSKDQNLDRQIKILEESGCERIFEEKVSGASRERPELENMLSYIRQGDTLFVHSMNRLARSTRDQESC